MVKVKRAAHSAARKPSAIGMSKRNAPKRKASKRKASKRKILKRKAPGVTPAAAVASSESDMAVDMAVDMAIEDQFVSTNLSLHELFQQQTRQILDRTDLEEDQKQHILVAMSCPCCGAGAMSFTAKLRR